MRCLRIPPSLLKWSVTIPLDDTLSDVLMAAYVVSVKPTVITTKIITDMLLLRVLFLAFLFPHKNYRAS